MTRRSRLATRPRLEGLEIRAVLTALTPAQLTAAYGLNSIAFQTNGATVKGDGTGQTIALIDAYHDANLASELATFDARYSLPAANLAVKSYTSTVDSGWSGEEALDVEWASRGGRLMVTPASISRWQVA